MFQTKRSRSGLLAILLLALAAFVLNGCLVVHARPHGKYPRGHTWSNGKCYAKGKGHDPVKKKHKAKKKYEKHYAK